MACLRSAATCCVRAAQKHSFGAPHLSVNVQMAALSRFMSYSITPVRQLTLQHSTLQLRFEPTTSRCRLSTTIHSGFDDPDSIEPTDPNEIPGWRRRKEAEKALITGAWKPAKRLSRESMTTLRLMHETDPQQFTINKLADRFGISLFAVIRILKSKFAPSSDIVRRQDTNKQLQKEQRRAQRLSSIKPPTSSDSVQPNSATSIGSDAEHRIPQNQQHLETTRAIDSAHIASAASSSPPVLADTQHAGDTQQSSAVPSRWGSIASPSSRKPSRTLDGGKDRFSAPKLQPEVLELAQQQYLRDQFLHDVKSRPKSVKPKIDKPKVDNIKVDKPKASKKAARAAVVDASNLVPGSVQGDSSSNSSSP